MRGIGTAIALLAITLLLRSTALSVLAGRGVVIDVLAFAVTVWAMRRGEASGTIFGFALGLLADLDAAHWLGRHALALSLVGYAVGRVSHTLVRDRARSAFVLLVVTTALHQAWTFAFEIENLAGATFLLRQSVLAAAATAPLGTLVLGLIRRVSGRPLFSHASLRSAS